MLRGKGWRIHFFDEMTGQGGEVRSPYREYSDWFGREDAARIQRKTQQAEAFFRTTGITFNVYGEDEADERLIPFRSEEHTSELQSLMRISYAVFCLKKKKTMNIEE